MTAHAARRLCQRGISSEALDLLLTYGTTRHDHRRGMVIYFDHNSRRIFKRGAERSKGWARYESKLLGCYAVM
jgi:hypothetical protein